MAVYTFTSKLNEDDMVLIPTEIIQKLGIHSGDEIQLQVAETNGTDHKARLEQDQYNLLAIQLLEEARNVTPERGKAVHDPTEAKYVEVLKEKYRKQGFTF